jgi:transposase
VKAGGKCLQQLLSGDTKLVLAFAHLAGSVLGPDSLLIGVKKGVWQILKERGKAYAQGKCVQQRHRDEANKSRSTLLAQWKLHREDEGMLLALLSLPLAAHVLDFARKLPCCCPKCTLAEEWDFKSQKSGLEEVYMRHNQVHSTQHLCKFLPKFHPELNPIERVWSRMKYWIRKYSTGKLEDLARHMEEGLAEENLPLMMIRKYIRLITCYYIAYSENKDIVAADRWIRKHRSHRGHSDKMDRQLEELYFPLGRQHVDLMREDVVQEEVRAVEREDEGEVEELWDGLVEWFGEEDFRAESMEVLCTYDA